MRLSLFTTIFILVLVILIPGILGVGIHKIPSGFQPPLNDSQQLYGPISVSQTFTSQHGRLSGFALTIKNSNNVNKKDITMTLTQNNQLVRQVTLNGKNIPDGGYINFQFNPITQSQNQTYIATFTAPNATFEDTLELYHSYLPYDGVYQVNNELRDGSLSFVLYFAPENVFTVWLIIYRNWIFKFFQDLPFAVFYLLVLIGLTCFLCVAFFSYLKPSKSRPLH